jgi:hypothetical protein
MEPTCQRAALCRVALYYSTGATRQRPPPMSQRQPCALACRQPNRAAAGLVPAVHHLSVEPEPSPTLPAVWRPSPPGAPSPASPHLRHKKVLAADLAQISLRFLSVHIRVRHHLPFIPGPVVPIPSTCRQGPYQF